MGLYVRNVGNALRHLSKRLHALCPWSLHVHACPHISLKFKPGIQVTMLAAVYVERSVDVYLYCYSYTYIFILVSQHKRLILIV